MGMINVHSRTAMSLMKHTLVNTSLQTAN